MIQIPCTGCGELIETSSLKQWYCKKCIKLRNKNWRKQKNIEEPAPLIIVGR